jgi:hypothetical protein
VASAASSLVPPGGIDAHSEQSTAELANEATRTTGALATKLVEDGIETATRAVERGMDAAVPIVQSAEELSTQYVVPIGDRIANSKSVAAAIDMAANTIEHGFDRVQGPVARLEGLVLQYVAAPIDARLGRFSAWADQQTPESLAAGVSGWARRTAASASTYVGGDAAAGGGLLQGLRARWAGKGSAADAPPGPAAAAAEPADSSEFLAARLAPPEALPPLQDPANQL